MRKEFANLLLEAAKKDNRIILLTADLGYKLWDEFREELPNQFYNVGSAEQLLVGAGVGLALSGKIPILYSITPFLVYRPFELIRNYLVRENIPVKLVGSGSDKDYDKDGISHWAHDVYEYVPDVIEILEPRDKASLEFLFEDFILPSFPQLMILKRSTTSRLKP